MAIPNVNSVCTRIHEIIQASGLHFVINQTPWSSYITIRRKFVNQGGQYLPDELRTFSDEKERLEKKLAYLETELEAKKKEKDEYQESFKKLHSKLETLESEVVALEKEKKVKDDVIKNINAGFNEKVIDLNEKIKHLEAVNRDVLKKEKKALKKLRQKNEKEAAYNINKSIDPPGKKVIKDSNENIFVEGNEVSSPITGYSSVQNDSFPEISQPDTCSLPHPTSASAGFSSPVRRTTIPSTPTTSFTPGHSTGSSLHSEQSVITLSTYFGNSATDVTDDLSYPAPVDLKKYVENISKISLVPQSKKERKESEN